MSATPTSDSYPVKGKYLEGTTFQVYPGVCIQVYAVNDGRFLGAVVEATEKGQRVARFQPAIISPLTLQLSGAELLDICKMLEGVNMRIANDLVTFPSRDTVDVFKKGCK